MDDGISLLLLIVSHRQLWPGKSGNLVHILNHANNTNHTSITDDGTFLVNPHWYLHFNYSFLRVIDILDPVIVIDTERIMFIYQSLRSKNGYRIFLFVRYKYTNLLTSTSGTLIQYG
jgi:hypothetical protein